MVVTFLIPILFRYFSVILLGIGFFPILKSKFFNCFSVSFTKFPDNSFKGCLDFDTFLIYFSFHLIKQDFISF